MSLFKKTVFSWALLALGFAPVWGAVQPLKVISATPKGQQTYMGGRTPITVTFNQPVAKLSEQSAFSSGKCPLSITPAVKGNCRYSGTQSLVFEPAENWPQATPFKVRLAKGFASAVNGARLQADYVWTFTTQRIMVNSTRPYQNERWLSLNPTLYIVFSQQPDVKRAAEFLELSYQQVPQESAVSKIISRVSGKKNNEPETKTVPLLVREIGEAEHKRDFSWETRANILAVSPSETLPKGVKFTLTVKEGFPAVKGSLGLEKPYQLVFYTYPPLKTMGAQTQGCLPYAPSIYFSSPVRLKDLMAAAQVTPAQAKGDLSNADENALGREVLPATGEAAKKPGAVKEAYFDTPLSFLKLEPGQEVTVTLPADLRDIYGNKLGKEETFTFTNEGYCPAVDYQGGTGVLESYLPARLPLSLINIQGLETQAAVFSKEDLIPQRQQSIPYCSKAELQNTTFSGTYSFKAPKNKSVQTYFDLEKFQPTSQNSVVLSQVKVPSKNRKEGYCWVQSLSNITDLGVTLKTSPKDILVWVTSLKNAEPMANLGVELRDRTNKVLWSGSTDMNGLAHAPGWEKLDVEKPGWGKPEIYAFVSSPGGDAVLSSDWNEGMEPWRFNVNYDYDPKDTLSQVQLFSDRGIYRPGETVHLKGVLRTLKNGVWTLPGYARGTVKVYNSRGEEASSQDVEVSSAFGTFDLAVQIPSSAVTGSWDVSFKPQSAADVQGGFYSFRVEAVKQAEFKVNLRAGETDYTPGEDAKFLVSADYLFGAPVAGGKTSWTVRQAPLYTIDIDGFDGYDFTPYFLRPEGAAQSKVISREEGVLDGSGAMGLNVVMPKVSVPMDIYAEAGVQSPSNQELFARTSVRLNPAGFYVGVKIDEPNIELGDTIKADVAAVTPKGVRTSALVQTQIRKEEWFSVRKTGLSGRLEWVSEKKETNFPAASFTLPAEGYQFSYTPTEPGQYYVTFTTQDSAGRKVLGGFSFMVFGKGQAYWKRSDDDVLVLKTDKDFYKPGQTAKVQVQSPYEEAVALVSVEREGVLDAWTATVKGGADYVEVPVKPEYLPNVYVSVTLARGRSGTQFNEEGLDLGKPQGKQGYAVLQVQPDMRKVQTTVKAEVKEYRPGEEVTLNLRTKVNGEAVPAEVTVMVVDEGVLALSDYKTPDLFKAFYGSRALSVSTADNRAFIIGQRNFGEKGENRGGGGSDQSKLGGVDLRSHFEFTPYFNASVVTDAKGKAEVTFKLPDNLTTFRIMAVAVTAAEFGSAETSVKVSKPIMVTANMPRFARKGDKFSCGAVVHNYEDKKGEIVLNASAQGAVKLAEETKTVQVAKGASAVVYWDCEAVEDGSAQVSFTAQARKEKDGVQASLNVLPVEKEQTLSTYSATDKQEEQSLQKPQNINPLANNRVETALSSTALVNLKGSMLYLLTYPYDCLEQKMSKILPVVEGADLIDAFKLGDTSSLRKQTQDILNEVSKYQYPTGGYAYWPGSLPDPYVTAYALEVNYLAKQKGYQVDEASLQKAVKWLADNFAQDMVQAYPYTLAERGTSQAYAVYVLSLYGQKLDARFNTLYAKRNTLSQVAAAYLLKAAKTAEYGDQTQRKVLGEMLLSSAVILPQTLHFQQQEPLPWLHFDDVKTTAVILQAALQTGVEVPQPYKAVNWLLGQLDASGHWSNTSVNAAVFSALDTYYRTQEATEPDFTAEVKLGAAQKLTNSFKGRELTVHTHSVPFADVYAQGDTAPAVFSKKGTGNLYYSLSQVYAPARFDTPVDAGFTVERSITELDGSPVTQFKAGQRYKVTLKVKNTTSRSFVVLEDFIPAGFELVNTSLATESQADAAALQNPGWGSFFRSEQYDERIAAFADYLTAGEHEFSYLVSAPVPGRYAYPAAWVQMMYEPAVFGRTATQEATVLP